MSAILHYTKTGEDGEYIVITNGDVNQDTIEDFREPGYEFYASYDIDETGTLPTEQSLRAS